MDKRTYWDTFDTQYQHGAQKHRLFILDLFKQHGVTSLLDVGCGTGPIYDLIINAEESRWDNITDYKGVDYSWAMIDVARKHFGTGKWEVEDARSLGEDDNSWDCVLLMHSLDHLDDYQSAIREAARVAKKYVCIVLWRSFVEGRMNHLNPKNMYGKQEGEEPWEDTFLQEYSRELLEEEFAKDGLKVIVAENGEVVNDPNKYNFVYFLEKESNA